MTNQDHRRPGDWTGSRRNVPIANTALLSSKLIRDATLEVYPGAPHGLTVTHKDKFNEDLLTFMNLLTFMRGLS